MFDDFQDIEDMYEGEGSATVGQASNEALLPARESDVFIGHENVEQSILPLISNNTMPHAIILAGQKGIGKATFAFRLSRALFKHGVMDASQDSLFGDTPQALETLDVENSHPVFSKVAAGGHPDLLTIERSIDAKKGTPKNNIDVNTARKVAPFLRMTSADGGWRVVIIDDADTMNRNAQNAILKILEEPPKNALLMLVTHRLGAMIPTIRSRCRVFNFKPLMAQDFKALTQGRIGTELDNNDLDLLNFLSQGSIGNTLNIIDAGTLDTAKIVLDTLEKHPNFNWVDIHHLSENVARVGQEQHFKILALTLNRVFESLLFSKIKGQNDNLLPPINHNLYNALMSRYSIEDLMRICDDLRNHFKQVEFSNLDKKQATLAAFNLIR